MAIADEQSRVERTGEMSDRVGDWIAGWDAIPKKNSLSSGCHRDYISQTSHASLLQSSAPREDISLISFSPPYLP